jgi:6-phosphogluconolactonase
VPSVICYKIGRQGKEASLKLSGALPIGDGGASHVAVDETGSTVLTAQYGGGSVAAYRLNADGSLKEQTVLIEHEGGSGVVAGRQDASHAHWVGFSPDNRFAFVPDLGLDKVVIYAHDPETSMITPHGSARVPAGGGPRHMKFHPNGRWVYVLNELSLSVTVFDYNADTAAMTPKQTIQTVPKTLLAKEKFKSASEIRVHPNGRFVYSANRGHDTITVFRVNQDTGELSVIELENVRGATPRNFNLDPSGRWLVAAGQDSNTLASFEVDSNSGELTYNRSNVFAPAPICVLFEHE